jgi:hypothetical protein
MYGPSPYTARLKCPSGQQTTSGLVIPGLRDSSILAREEWNSCRRNFLNLASLLYFLSAAQFIRVLYHEINQRIYFSGLIKIL